MASAVTVTEIDLTDVRSVAQAAVERGNQQQQQAGRRVLDALEATRRAA